MQNFNPRSHKGSDKVGNTLRESVFISIHAPTRGATVADLSEFWSGQRFQSTLPQGERQCGITLYGPPTDISIHAPTRGATGDKLNNNADNLISIHAPTRGATAILHKIPYLFYFIFTNPFPISYFHTQPASDF